MTKSLKTLLMLTICLCALLLCGSALAEMEMYSVNIENFDSDVMPYCLETELSVSGGSEINSSGIGAMVNQDVTIRIVPSANCSVDAIAYRYTEDGYTQRENCTLRADASGAVTTTFRMPQANVILTVTMSREGEETYEVQGSFQHCTGTISDGGQTGSSLFAAPGSTLTVTVTPEDKLAVDSMTYTTYHDQTPRKIPFTENKNGVATGTLTMPEDRVIISVSASMYCLSHSETGGSLGNTFCTDYQKITNSSATWVDLSSGWYVVQGNVTLSKDTTLRVTGDVHLILCDGAKLTAGDGVYIKKGSSLSVYSQRAGTGKLVAKPDSGPGIGGMADTVGGSLYIHGGVIEAVGGTNAAGIGGGNHASGYGDIVIYGGSVTAKGGSSGAGIGKGQQNSPSDCGEIVIYGGEVNASSAKYGAGIGGGEDRDGGTIRIYGGKVTASGGHDGAGIGGGEGGHGGDILIAGGTVKANGGSHGAGIGGGEKGHGGTILITGGHVTAESEYYGAGIGGGEKGHGGTITITGGTVNAIGSNRDISIDVGWDTLGGGAAIGGGQAGNTGTIRIEGGTVTANCREILYSAGAAIGGGGSYQGSGGSITITGGTVKAYGENGAGIGGGNYDFQGTITITDGTVYTSSITGAGIGCGYAGSFCGKVVISGGTVNAHGRDGAGIGAGSEDDHRTGGEDKGIVEITGGKVIAGSDKGTAIGYGCNGDELGTLTIGDSMQVTAGSASGNATRQVRKNSVDGCRSKYAVIESCIAHEIFASYDVAHDTHTPRCVYCNVVMGEPENHIYDDGACTVCGFAGALVTIHYLPGDPHALRTMGDETCPPDTAYILAKCQFNYSGYEFAGWKVGETDTILPAGTECRFIEDTTLTATWRNNWSDLQNAINGAESGTVIQLNGDTVASVYDTFLSISADKTVTLDLKGCTLDRGLTESKATGQVIVNNGNLTITDSVGGGIITGGFGANGSDGGAIVNNGTLTLEGGTISGNKAVNSAGAVLNKSGASFTMTGGVISGNSSGIGGGGAVVNYGTMTLSGGAITGNVSRANGGGIWSNGTLHISGGSVTGNTAKDKGAGVYAHGNGTLTLSGSPVIADNNSTDRGVNNLHINRDNNKLPTITAGTFTEDSRISVSCSVAPTASAPVAIISGVTGEIPQIMSDSNKYMLSFNSGDSKLYLALAPKYTVTVSEDVTNGTVTADQTSAYAGDTVTLTAAAEENYILAGLTWTQEGGEAKSILPDAETGAYRFTMPAANVTVSASFIQDKTSASVQLVWDDGGSTESRPDNVYVTLLDLLEPVRSVELTASTGWAATQNDLPMNHNGELASYTWTIDDSDLPAGYSLTGNTVSGELSTLTLTPAQPVTIAQSEYGTVTASKGAAAQGETVTLTVTPDAGYMLKTLTCTAGSETLNLTFDEAAGTYAFVMPAQAVTVTAVFEDIPSDWQLLQALIDGAQAGDTITLTQDYRGEKDDVPLKIVSGRKVTIDLNGHTIDGWSSDVRIFTVNGGELTIEGSGTITGGHAGNSVGGAFIVQGGGKLTLNGGSIDTNDAGNGGGGVAVTNGTFVMNGGEIWENETTGTGGGVRVQGGTFIMNGGEICANGADGNGGGLWVGEGSIVRITGGSFWNNEAALGQDVYLNGVGMSVSGNPDITEVYVANTVITVGGALDQGARIGLTCSNTAAKNGAALTNGLSGNGILANFPSVKNGYASALNADGEVYLGTARTVTFDRNDGSGQTEKVTVADGTVLAEPEAPVREGYAFLGWQLNGADYDFDTPVTQDLTLTAQWLEIPPYGTPDFTLPEDIITIEESAFEGAAMTVVFIPDGCESIGNYAFKGCRNLTRIRVPAGCTLGMDVFSGCGTVFVYSTAGSPAEAWCASHDSCVFAAE